MEWNKSIIIFPVVFCILILSKSFIYQLMHNTVDLKEYMYIYFFSFSNAATCPLRLRGLLSLKSFQ